MKTKVVKVVFVFKEKIGEFAPDDIKFNGNAGEVQRSTPHVYLVGLGEEKKVALHHVWNAARLAAEKINKERIVDEIDFQLEHINQSSINAGLEQIVHAVYLGATTGLYAFNKYKKDKKEETTPRISLSHPSYQKSVDAFQKDAEVIADAYIWTRDMIESAPNYVYPESFCEIASNFLAPSLFHTTYENDLDDDAFIRMIKRFAAQCHNTSLCYIFDSKRIERIFPSLWAVGKGAEHKPRMLAIEYKHQNTTMTKPILFVGKGICMDTGGDDSKDAERKKGMRMDMSGAAIVTGAVKAISDLNLPVWIVSIAPLAMNKPGPTAYTQEEVVGTYKNGPTTLIRNTDAEGRVVLSDGLRFGALEWDPKYIIELSTLTGAAIISVGNWGRTLAMSNDKELEKLFSEAVDNAGQRVSFEALDDEAFENIKDKEGGADHVNIGNCGRWGGALTAGAFLFAKLQGEEKEWPMIHWDIAPTHDKPEYRGQEIRTLIHFIKMLVKKENEYHTKQAEITDFP